tara:strand:+ start:7289 stop:7504 length:216 start_codon:yes stop_codon:yes gene_type:complete
MYLIQEEYKENVVGVRVVSVIADSKQDVLDGDYEMNDIVEELIASADCYETSMVDDVKYLLGNWKEIVKED